MTDLLPVSIAEMVIEAQRELTMRKRIYPDRVRTGRMNRRQADRRIDVMQAILDRLEDLQREERQR